MSNIKKIILEKLNISEEELNKLIKEKKEEYGGIVTDEAILRIIANEYNIDIDDELGEFLIKDIREGQINVEIIGVVKDVSEIKTFKRKDGSEGKYRKVVIADKSGEIVITLWDELAEKDIKVGDILKIRKAKSRIWRDKIELSSGKDTSIRILESTKKELPEVKEIYKINELEPGITATIEGVVKSSLPPKETKKDNKTVKFRSFILEDETGSIRVVLWDELAEKDIKVGDKVRVRGYIRRNYYFKDSLECTANNVEIIERGEIKKAPIIKISELDDYESYELVSVEGTIKVIGGKRYINIDGEKRSLQEIILNDGSDDIIISFWGFKKALLEGLKEGDVVRIYNLRISKYIDKEGNLRINLVATQETEIEKIGETDYKLKFYKIGEILENPYIEDINIIGVVTEDFGVNEVIINDKIRKVRNIILEDETGRIKLSLWDELAESDIKEGDTLGILHANARIRDNFVDLSLGRFGRIEKVDIKIFPRKFIADLKDNEIVEIRGTIVKILSGPVIKICPSCKKRVEDICEECGVEGVDRLSISFILDDGTDTILCKAYDKKVEKILKNEKENIYLKSFEEIEKELLGEEIILLGYVKVDEEKIFYVKGVYPFNIDKEIKILKDGYNDI